MQDSGRLILRADAGSHGGTGHLMRCYALALAWQGKGGFAVFLSSELPQGLAARIQEAGFPILPIAGRPGSPEDGRQTQEYAQSFSAAAVVVDGYCFEAAYQKAIKLAGFPLVAIDDYGHAEHYWADVVLNQNAYAAEHFYQSREANTRLLLGTRYALLRPEFRQRPASRRSFRGEACHLLVTLGGADPPNATLKVIQALNLLQQDSLEAVVLVGASNPRAAELKDAAAQIDARIRFLDNASDMPGLMAWADVAIAGAGTTCWELAFMGVPSLLVVLAENQRPIARSLAEAGAAVNLGEAESLSVERIAEELGRLLASPRQCQDMSTRARALVDGLGAVRVAEEISHLVQEAAGATRLSRQ